MSLTVVCGAYGFSYQTIAPMHFYTCVCVFLVNYKIYDLTLLPKTS